MGNGWTEALPQDVEAEHLPAVGLLKIQLVERRTLRAMRLERPPALLPPCRRVDEEIDAGPRRKLFFVPRHDGRRPQKSRHVVGLAELRIPAWIGGGRNRLRHEAAEGDVIQVER